LEHKWERAETVRGAVIGGGGAMVPLKKLWLHVPDDEMEDVEVTTTEPEYKPMREQRPAACGDGESSGANEGGGGGAAPLVLSGAGPGTDDEVDPEFD
jgi:hypothetical protein